MYNKKIKEIKISCVKDKKRECNCKKCKPLHNLLKKYPIF
jgi:hypothetical protein